MSAALSPSAEQFLRLRVASPLHLEVLLMLRRDVTQWWSAETLSMPLRASVESTERALEALGAANLVDVKLASSVVYRFAPLERVAVSVLDEIAAMHCQDRAV